MVMIKKQIHLTKNSMIKRFLVLLIAIQFSNCAQQQKVINTLPKDNILTEELISKGIHQALVNGIKKQIPKLICEDGFYRNKIVKISLDKELKDVDKRLREIGLNNLADEGVKVLNRAAEDAVKNATPIIVNTIKEISFNDPKNILLGENNEATKYLKNKTRKQLHKSFKPIVKNSISKVKADIICSKLITRYNAIPFVKQVNPDLTIYVTNKALEGIYTMIEIEEKEVRTKICHRNSILLRQVFALQDKKSFIK